MRRRRPPSSEGESGSWLARLPQILDAHGLALRARDLARGLEHDLACDADHCLDVVAQVGRHLRGERLVARSGGRELDLNRQGVHASLTGEYELIVRREPRKTDQNRLNLRRIDVDAADD